MKLLLEEFDPTPKAVLNPEHFLRKGAFPEICVCTFPHGIVEKYAALEGAERIGSIGGANGPLPVYRILYRDTPIAFCMAPVGAPACVGDFEELIALGAGVFVYFGSCAVLDREIADGHIVVPTAALRDEGTSFHYAPPSEEISLEPRSVQAVTETLRGLGYPYVQGKTWTTDAFYRETPKKVARRKEQGAIVVEMECASLTAAARFRGVRFAEFFFSADNLDGQEGWEPRGLSDQGMTNCERYMAAAFECGLRLASL